ncbi:MAG: precorrin-6B methylase [Stomatobaculum sp.]|jgi:precorrin-6Y C5,15-methyltransferase (decarboxylating)|nr:precorrin-6B methylase [Stomatobaculum sp.]
MEQEKQMFSNDSILAWLTYYAETTNVDLQKVKILDITRKNKNLIPTVESHNATLVFTEAGHPDIFYRMWTAGLGECTVWYNEGSDPSGQILHKPIREMINRGINASAAMLIMNPNARSTSKIGMKNMNFSRGSVHYVGSEIRAAMMSKMHIDQADNICIISGESLAVEAALLAPEGTIIAVEYSQRDRRTLEDNAHEFGLHNIEIIDHVDDESLKGLPVPTFTMLVASASMEQEIEALLRVNPHMEFLIYTLDFQCAASLPALFDHYGIGDTEVIQISVSKLNAKRNMVAEPAPWLITGQA